MRPPKPAVPTKQPIGGYQPQPGKQPTNPPQGSAVSDPKKPKSVTGAKKKTPAKKAAPKKTASPAKAEKTKRGRPTLFTEDHILLFLAAIRIGKTEYKAAEAAGWSPSSYEKYRQQAEDDAKAGKTPEESDFVRLFKCALAYAREDFIQEQLDAIRSIATSDGDWRARAYLLEKADPARFGKQTNTTVKGDKNAPLEVSVRDQTLQAELSNMTPEQKVAYIKSFVAVLNGPDGGGTAKA